jgi:hypothetical protein
MSHTDRTVLERRHLLLNPTIGRLADAIDRSSFASLRAQEETEGFHERPTKTDRFFREGRAGQWKDILTASQVSQIVKDHGHRWRASITCRVDRAALFRRLAFPDLMTKSF